MRLALLLAGTALAGACGEDTTAPIDLDEISVSIVGGNGQSGVVGMRLAEPLRVVATNRHGPIPNLSVEFEVTQGDGHVLVTETTTDANGVAQNLWTLGTSSADSHEVVIRAIGTGARETERGRFSANALPGPAVAMAIHRGDGQMVPANSTVPIRPAVRITDQFGNPVPGEDVTFSIPAGGGGGTVAGPNRTTWTNGVAKAWAWTLGPTPGQVNQLEAVALSPAVNPRSVTFTATAVGATPTVTWLSPVDGSWSDPLKWSTGVVPQPSDDVGILLDGTYTVTMDIDASVNSLSIGPANGAATLVVENQTLTLAGASAVGPNGTLRLKDAAVRGTGSLANWGLIHVRPGTTELGVALFQAGTLRVTWLPGDAFVESTLSIAEGFTNAGLIELIRSTDKRTLVIETGTLSNTGTIRSEGSGNGNRIIGSVDNSGTIAVTPGSGSFGRLTILNAGRLFSTVTGKLDLQSGLLVVDGGTMDVGRGTAITGYSSGLRLMGSHTVRLASDFTIPSGKSLGFPGIGPVAIEGPGRLINRGVLTLTRVTINTDLVNKGTATVFGAGNVINGALLQRGDIKLKGRPAWRDASLVVTNGVTNSGALTLTGVDGYSGVLAVTGGTLVNEPAGRLETISVQAIESADNRITGSIENEGLVSVKAPLRILNAGHTFTTTSGKVDVHSGQSLEIEDGTVVVDGTTKILNTGTLDLKGAATLVLAGDVTVDGPFWQFGGPDAITVDGPGTLINRVGLVLQNDVVNADVDNRASGTLLVASGSSAINGALTQAGTLRLSGNGGNASLVVDQGFTNEGLLELRGVGASGLLTLTNGTLTNDAAGTIATVTGVNNQITGSLSNQGLLTLGAPLTLDGIFTHGIGALLQGSSTLDVTGATVAFDGDVDPGTAGSPATLTVTGDLDLASTSAVNIDLELGGIDVLSVSGVLGLDGTLNANRHPAFVPSIGSTLEILTYGSANGSFQTENGVLVGFPSPTPDRQFVSSQQATAFELEVQPFP